MRKPRKSAKKKSLKRLKSLVDPTQLLKHLGIAAVAGCMAGILAAILHGAF